MVNKFILSALLVLFGNSAVASNCVQMADMAKDIANLRDAGVPMAAVEARLKRDVADPAELGVAIVAVRLVYKTRATGEQLRREVIKQCSK